MQYTDQGNVRQRELVPCGEPVVGTRALPKRSGGSVFVKLAVPVIMAELGGRQFCNRSNRTGVHVSRAVSAVLDQLVEQRADSYRARASKAERQITSKQ